MDFRDDDGNIRPHFKILPIVLAGLFLLFQYLSSEKYTNPVTGQSHRVGMSTQQEAALGLQSYQQILSQEHAIASGPEVDEVNTVAKRLATAVGKDGEGFEWEVSVLDSPQMNAFCLPGGKICVYTGILPVAKTEGGLAAVMGHEMSHAIARHGSQRILQQQMTSTAMLGIQGSMSNMSYDQQRTLMGLLGAGAQYGVTLPFSRKHESEADYMETTYMARAGYDPHEAVELWKRMSESSQGQKPPEYASTHPADATRIRQLEEWMPQFMAEYEKARAR
ncbi:MAG: M48 family metallopeptidase [Chthoniobacter sp.]|nr:M48 family metallopeptidase [Chthoniobacter sp.]